MSGKLKENSWKKDNNGNCKKRYRHGKQITDLFLLLFLNIEQQKNRNKNSCQCLLLTMAGWLFD